MTFKSEKEFEENVVELLKRNGWEIKNKDFKNGKTILRNSTEEDLIENWKKIIFLNNMGIDELNNVELNDDEMGQIMQKLYDMKGDPIKTNEFVTSGRVTIDRTNEADTFHVPNHRSITLNLFDKESISTNTIYQIAEQPIMHKHGDEGKNRRGDLMLLINGMPLIHIELKNANVSVSEAESQLEKYIHENKYMTGIYSLVQIFIAMTPKSTIYWANPGPNKKDDNRTFHFHWADHQNNVIDEYTAVIERFLNIPTAHHLIGYYTVADQGDKNLKVMRSYQVHAVEAICNRITEACKDWDAKHRNLGGYVWHTTGSGKTMTSIKAAERISELRKSSKEYLIDKVIFLMDRVELTTQSYLEYKNLIGSGESVANTEDTGDLQNKILSINTADKLIVTSIQKINILSKSINENTNVAKDSIQKLRTVFIVDECHRSTFGDMLSNTKKAFPNAIFFGFTGTPIFDVNSKTKGSRDVDSRSQTLTTLDLFGDRLHEYNLSHGIRDHNVLGFDVAPVYTFDSNEMKKEVGLRQCGVKTLQELDQNPQLLSKFESFKTRPSPKTYKTISPDGEEELHHDGIESYFPVDNYKTEENHNEVINNIQKNWDCISSNGYFHAILATSSIVEAIDYYKLFKERKDSFPIKVTALFDTSEDPSGEEGAYKKNLAKNEAIKEIFDDYNLTFETNFAIENPDAFKKDISSRLAHKANYTNLPKEKQLDLLIVVDQMLTGFDSKYLNALYLDKEMKYQNIIQAFSRTNRLFNGTKPKSVGVIRYYRYPETMKSNINDAISIYSIDTQHELFVDKLADNIKALNACYNEIRDIFKNSNGEVDFSTLPDDEIAQKKFVSEFNKFNNILSVAKVQGFSFDKIEYDVEDGENGEVLVLEFDHNNFIALGQRYEDIRKEIEKNPSPDGNRLFDIQPYALQGYSEQINTDYFNKLFDDYKITRSKFSKSSPEVAEALAKLHDKYSLLSAEDQKFADIVIKKLENNQITVDETKTFMDYIHEESCNEMDMIINEFIDTFGVDKEQLVDLINKPNLKAENINDANKFNNLCATKNEDKIKEYFYNRLGDNSYPKFERNKRFTILLRRFVLNPSDEYKTIDLDSIIKKK